LLLSQRFTPDELAYLEQPLFDFLSKDDLSGARAGVLDHVNHRLWPSAIPSQFFSEKDVNRSVA
jgi:hypothetical protein